LYSRFTHAAVQRMDHVSIFPRLSPQSVRLVLRSTFIDVEAPPEMMRQSRSLSEHARPRHTISEEFQHEQMYVNTLAERAEYFQGRPLCAPKMLGTTTRTCKFSAWLDKHPPPRKKCEAYFSKPKKAADSGDANDAEDTSADGESSAFTTSSWCRSTSEATTATTMTSLTNVDSNVDFVGPDDESAPTSFGTDLTEGGDGEFSVSQGSFGHPHLCERVCTYAPVGRCLSGVDCRYCHIPHTAKQPHLDKRNRRMILAMPFKVRAEVMLPLLEQKARDTNFGPSCDALLTLLAKEANLTRGCLDVPSKLPEHRGLRRVMASMSFYNVLRHLLSGPPAPAALSIDDVPILLEDMRFYVAGK